jgi:hypothetical protein
MVAWVVQLAEQRSLTPYVAGSNPAPGTMSLSPIRLILSVKDCRIWLSFGDSRLCLTAPFEIRKNDCFLTDRRVCSARDMTGWLEKNAVQAQTILDSYLSDGLYCFGLTEALRVTAVDDIGVIFLSPRVFGSYEAAAPIPFVRPFAGMSASSPLESLQAMFTAACWQPSATSSTTSLVQ